MKKNLKKILATAFATSLAFVSVIGSKPVTVKADSDYTAFLMYCDENWGNGNWDSTYASTTVSSEGGSYTVTLNATDVGADGATAITGAQVFCVDITGAQEGLSADGKTFALTDISVELDGQAIDVDASKVVTGDIEENGNYRIEIYNPGGGGATGTDSPIDASALSFTNTIAVNFSLDVVDAASDSADGSSAEVSTEQTAFLMFCDENWGNGNWDSTFASTTVSGDGTYTVTLNATDVGADGATAIVGSQVFCVDVTGLSASVTDPSAISLDDISVELDGQAIDVDASKVVTGDIEENGNYRIEIYNPGGGGDTGSNPPIDPAALTFTNTISVTFTLSGITYGESAASDDGADADAAPVASVDLDGTYHAYLGIQTPAYSFRNAYDDSTYGYGTDYFNQITGWVNNEAVKMDGTITDAEIAGNGTYTVSISGMNFDASEFADQDYMNLIFLSTDIPNSGEITISDIVLNVDGQTPSINPILSPDSVDYVNMLIQNIWNDDVKTIGYYSVPPTEISITFTVSGFNYDNADAAGDVATDSVDTEKADTDVDSAAPVDTEASTEESSSGVSTGVVVVIVIVVIVVVAAAVGFGVYSSKKKKEGESDNK